MKLMVNMNICDRCIHNEVCGLKDNNEKIAFCSEMMSKIGDCKMVFNQTNFHYSEFHKDLRGIFCDAVIKVFGDSRAFIDVLEKGKYSTKYDCYVDYDEENYIINRETGEYINWYKLYHLGRDIHISTLLKYKNIPKWIEEFLVEFKESEDKDE